MQVLSFLPAHALGIYVETSGDVDVELTRKNHSENYLLSNKVVGHLESTVSW